MAQCTVCTYFCHFWLSKLVSRNSELPCQYDLCKSSAIVNIAKVREDDDKETAFRGCKENLFEQVKIVKFHNSLEHLNLNVGLDGWDKSQTNSTIEHLIVLLRNKKTNVNLSDHIYISLHNR